MTIDSHLLRNSLENLTKVSFFYIFVKLVVNYIFPDNVNLLYIYFPVQYSRYFSFHQYTWLPRYNWNILARSFNTRNTILPWLSYRLPSEPMILTADNHDKTEGSSGIVHTSGLSVYVPAFTGQVHGNPCLAICDGHCVTPLWTKAVFNSLQRSYVLENIIKHMIYNWLHNFKYLISWVLYILKLEHTE